MLAITGEVEIVEEVVEEVEIIDLFNMSVTIEGEDNQTLSRDYYCASGDWWGWGALPYLNETCTHTAAPPTPITARFPGMSLTDCLRFQGCC